MYVMQIKITYSQNDEIKSEFIWGLIIYSYGYNHDYMSDIINYSNSFI